MEKNLTKDELLELLDIEHGSEFTYYENIAELLESEKEIGPDAIFEVLQDADMDTFAEIVESYFYDIMEKMPDNDVDIYNIFESVKRNFVALAVASKESKSGEYYDENLQNPLIKLCEELDGFHKYYALSDNCVVTDRSTGVSRVISLRDAISDNRLAIMDNKEYDFDLDGAKDYIIEEFIMGLSDLYDGEDYNE